MPSHPDVLRLVREYCEALPADVTRPTKAILLHLEERGYAGDAARYRDLDDAAQYELSDCATRAEPVTRLMYGRHVTVRPWLWHAPDGLETQERPEAAPAAKPDKWAEWRASVDARLNEILRILTDNK